MLTELLSDKAPGETRLLSFDFADELGDSAIESIHPTVVTQANTDGRVTDYLPEATLSGDPYTAGTTLYQAYTGGLDGVDYRYVATVLSDDLTGNSPAGHLLLQRAAIVRVRAT